jgi:hypothetical protein
MFVIQYECVFGLVQNVGSSRNDNMQHLKEHKLTACTAVMAEGQRHCHSVKRKTVNLAHFMTRSSERSAK